MSIKRGMGTQDVVLATVEDCTGIKKDFPGNYNAADPGSIPGSGRSPGEGNSNPLQYSCLENPTPVLWPRHAKS